MLVPNGKPIPAPASLKVSVKDEDYCFIEHNLTPDPATMKELTFDYFSKMIYLLKYVQMNPEVFNSKTMKTVDALYDKKKEYKKQKKQRGLYSSSSKDSENTTKTSFSIKL